MIYVSQLSYVADGTSHVVSVYPTPQFLYSHHVCPEYITDEIRALVSAPGAVGDPAAYCRTFLETVEREQELCAQLGPAEPSPSASARMA